MFTILERVTLLCFGASYAIALGLEIWQYFQPRPILRLLSLSFGAAGLLAHIAYLSFQPVPLMSPTGSLLFLALILTVFFLYGSVHHQKLAWGLFVLPLVLGLVGLAIPLQDPEQLREWDDLMPRFWGISHGFLVLLSAIGVSVGFIASVMYLVQVYRLKSKIPPRTGIRLLSLERLEDMHRRAVLWSFPLLTAGLLIGMVLQVHQGNFLEYWYSPRILSGLVLWFVFAILLYLRYKAHARGQQVALLTMLAFVLLVFVLVSPTHPFTRGDVP